MSFTQKDEANVAALLNFIAKKDHKFICNVDETIQFFGLLSWAQKELLPKVTAHIMEVESVQAPSKKK